MWKLRAYSLRWQLITTSLLVVGLPLLAFGVALGNLLWNFYAQQLEAEMRSKASIIADAAAPILAPNTPDDPAALARMVREWQNYSDVRVTLVDGRGIIQGAPDSAEVGRRFDDRRRPGLAEALHGVLNSTVWKNPEFGNQDTMYVNLPVHYGGSLVGAVRVSYTLTQIQNHVHRIRITIIGCLGVYGALIVVLTFLLAGRIVRPVEQLNRSAARFAAGELNHRVKVDGSREVVALGSTLNEMAARLETLEGLRRQYVSNLSHELRTPLAGIRGMAETMLQYRESDETLPDRYLPRIVLQTDRLARLAAQVLDLAQIESGNILGELTPIHLEQAVEETVQLLSPLARERGVELVRELSPELPPVLGDRDCLVQVFVNLLDNALRHTPSGGVVRVAAWEAGGRLVASISDTGCGIPREHLSHLFDRFYRVDSSRSRRSGGSGLGLSIVRGIVEAHGGSIRVESEFNVGTRFFLELPLQPEPVRPMATTTNGTA
jgi:signal transduction histidine kinase